MFSLQNIQEMKDCWSSWCAHDIIDCSR